MHGSDLGCWSQGSESLSQGSDHMLNVEAAHNMPWETSGSTSNLEPCLEHFRMNLHEFDHSDCSSTRHWTP